MPFAPRLCAMPDSKENALAGRPEEWPQGIPFDAFGDRVQEVFLARRRAWGDRAQKKTPGTGPGVRDLVGRQGFEPWTY